MRQQPQPSQSSSATANESGAVTILLTKILQAELANGTALGGLRSEVEEIKAMLRGADKLALDGAKKAFSTRD